MRLDPITLSSNSEIQSQPNTPFFPFCVALKSYGQVTLGGHSTSDPPLPISNRTVKRSRADDSAPTVCESRSPPGSPTYKAPHRSKHCGALRFTRHDSNLQTCCWSHDPPRANLDEKPLTGEPCAGEAHARFGGRGRRAPFPAPISRRLLSDAGCRRPSTSSGRAVTRLHRVPSGAGPLIRLE